MGNGEIIAPLLVRYPIIPLSYTDVDIAVERELIIDYTAGRMYVLKEGGSEFLELFPGLLTNIETDSIDVIDVDGSTITLTVLVERLRNSTKPNLESEFDIIYNELSQKHNIESVIGGYTLSSAMNTGRSSLGGAGSQDVALAFGGSGGITKDITEKFDGVDWSNTSVLNTARANLAGCGLQDAALAIGGIDDSNVVIDTVENFDGEIWSHTGVLNTARYDLASCGLQDAALAFGGVDSSSTFDTTEKFDGELWSHTGILNDVRCNLAGCGLQDAALAFGGAESSIGIFIETTEKFNGEIWSIVGDLITPRLSLGGCGLQDAALSFGGENNSSIALSNTELFNGIVWRVTNNLNLARSYLAGCGTQSYGLSFGGSYKVGEDTIITSATEKFYMRKWVQNINIRQAPALNSDGKLIVDTLGNAGTASKLETSRTITLEGDIAGSVGFDGSENVTIITSVDELQSSTKPNLENEFDIVYNELSQKHNIESVIGGYTVSSNMSTKKYSLGGVGLQNAALAFGGYNFSALFTSEKFDGIVWSNSIDLNTDRCNMGGCGLQDAALSFGGVDGTEYGAGMGTPQSTTENFDGEIWSITGSLNTARFGLAGCGTQNAALSFGGITSIALGDRLTVTEKFDGEVWSISGDLNTGRDHLTGCGLQDAALSIGGIASPVDMSRSIVEKFNGEVWSISGNINIGRYSLASAGSQQSSLIFGGDEESNSYSDSTELFNGIIWHSTGNLNIGRANFAGCGTQSYGLSFGGFSSSGRTSTTEKFSMRKWTTDNDIKQAPALNSDGKLIVDTLGNAGTASKLETSRTITLEGDIAGSVGFDGSENVTIITTIDNDILTLLRQRSISMNIYGTLSVATDELIFIVPYDMTMSKILMGLRVPAVGATIYVDIHKNGASIFAEQSERPHLESNESLYNAVTLAYELNQGDIITIDVDSIGTSTPGSDLSISIVCEVV